MARRRLHGETQKKRKKPDTRLLKLQGTTSRVTHTLKSAEFERSDELGRDDLEFLESMREMNVHRSPWNAQVPARTKAVEHVRFHAAEGEAGLFMETMESMGVKPMQSMGVKPPQPGNPREHSQTDLQPDHKDAEMEKPMADEPLKGSHPTLVILDDDEEAPDYAPLAQPHYQVVPPFRGDTNGSTGENGAGAVGAGGLRFEAEEDGHAVMESLMQDGSLDPTAKFEGAPKAPPRQQTPRIDLDKLEPDSELDLHGKTQEEAIHAVQNFLLVSHKQKLRHVLIITGKGRNSGESGPVLKEAVYRWVKLNGSRYASAFDWAPPRHGGEGALWITLRRR